MGTAAAAAAGPSAAEHAKSPIGAGKDGSSDEGQNQVCVDGGGRNPVDLSTCYCFTHFQVCGWWWQEVTRPEYFQERCGNDPGQSCTRVFSRHWHVTILGTSGDQQTADSCPVARPAHQCLSSNPSNHCPNSTCTGHK